jgi:CheY-like chemotaxis protein
LRFVEENTMPRIVIVDDNQALVAVYRKFFGMAGLTVIASFSSGSELLDFFEKIDSDHLQRGEDFVVLMDDLMPNLSGLDTASRLKRINHSTKVLLCINERPSAMILPTEIVDAVLQRPFSMEELLEVISRQIFPSHEILKGKVTDKTNDYSNLWTA